MKRRKVNTPLLLSETWLVRFSPTPVAAAMLLLSPATLAQTAQVSEGGMLRLEEIVVTAQKRAENMQDVPISLESLSDQTLKEHKITNFQEYAQLLPSLAFTPDVAAGSGFTKVYMRGVATAGDGQATTSQPSVGMYLDEQPITTIQGNLDIHMYDIARVEALSGPQGTLYGASSQAGTVRVLTNKPELGEYLGSFSLEGNVVDGDNTGYLAEGFVNVPLGEKAAIRLVGWSRRDAGYIDNVFGTRTFPGVASTTADDITVDNAAFVEDNYNTVDTVGGRAALKIDLNEEWTVTPTVIFQKQEAQGFWGDDLSSFASARNTVTHFQEETTEDEFTQIGLTIEGKIGNFDLTYSGSFLDREVDGVFDYSDYSYWYDTIYTTGSYADLFFSNTGPRAVANQFFDDAGTRLWPGAQFINNDGYERYSHELRISSPQDRRIRAMLGLYLAQQKHDFQQPFIVAGLADRMQLNFVDPNGRRFPDIVYLNSMDRQDDDEAVFGHISFDLTERLELTLGARFFRPEVSVVGFNGFGTGFSGIWSGTGEIRCSSLADVRDKPCINVDKGIAEEESIGRINMTYQISDDKMVYATWSEGYRPGGINRNPDAGEYVSDFLTNYEFGWKTQFFDNRLQLNGALFYEEWDDFQISVRGANAVRQVDNGPSAEIKGMESQLLWAASDNLRISSSFSLIDSELQDDYCCNKDDSPLAPAGTPLPITANFKGNIVARYSFDWRGWNAHWQASVAYEGERASDLNVRNNLVLGDVPSNTFVDLGAGIRNASYGVDVFVKNVTDEDAPIFLSPRCSVGTCGEQVYGIRYRPITVGVKFTKDF